MSDAPSPESLACPIAAACYSMCSYTAVIASSRYAVLLYAPAPGDVFLSLQALWCSCDAMQVQLMSLAALIPFCSLYCFHPCTA